VLAIEVHQKGVQDVTVLVVEFIRFISVFGEEVNNGTESHRVDDWLF